MLGVRGTREPGPEGLIGKSVGSRGEAMLGKRGWGPGGQLWKEGRAEGSVGASIPVNSVA